MIWHTQGGGMSIVMILLPQWILENNPKACVAVVTDRDQLDNQILGKMRACGLLSEPRNDGFY